MSRPKLEKPLPPAQGPLKAPVKAPATTAPVLAPASTPVGILPASTPLGSLPATTASPPINFSWVGIVGILAAFLVLAVMALVCFCYKQWTYKKALREERDLFAETHAARSNRKVWADDGFSTSKRGEMILAGFEQALVRQTSSKRLRDRENANFRDGMILATTMNMEQDIPVYTRDMYLSGGFNWNPGENLVDEVFYTGEEGSQMGVRYSRASVSNVETFGLVAKEASTSKVESESVSLLGALNSSHTIYAGASGPKDGWTLRTFSLPAYYHKNAQGSGDTKLGLKGEDQVEAQTRMITLTPHPISLPASPVHNYFPSAYGNNLTASPWARRPSRLSQHSNPLYDPSLQRPSFIVPPSTPPPPLPLPVTVDGVDDQEKSVQDRRRANKHDDSKWSTFNYCPSPPPPPLPVPFEAPPTPPPPPPPRRTLLGPGPPPPPGLPIGNGVKSPPPPPPGLPNKIGNGVKSSPPPPPPPTSSNNSSGPKPPPPPPPPSGGQKPKLTPLILPGRSGSGDLPEVIGGKPSSPKRPQKMRPLHWDKLKPESSQSMVWDNISNSMELDVEMCENLFGITSKASASEDAKKTPSATTPEKHELLDPRKAHNIAIQLRARGLSRIEICDALVEGDGLSQETLELLVKMTPTEDEVTKFEEYQGDPSMLGPAERFLLGVLQVPSAFERLQSMLYRASFKEELNHIQDTISVVEMACKELKGSRTFIKLLEAVLKTGNRLNMGTFRGDAKAFKLDTLLKLADVKGIDGKTTLLHFVIQEIIRAEGARAARMASFNDPTTPTSTTPTSTTPTSITSCSSSPLSHFARSMEAELERCTSESSHSEGKDDYRKIGLEVVRGIPIELGNVRKAGGLDIVALRLAVSKLVSGLQDMKATLEKLLVSKVPESGTRKSTYDLTDDVFREKMLVFVEEAEAEVSAVQRELDLVLASVKDISIYFYGEAVTATNPQPLKVFLVMREFLAMLEQACKDVMNANASLTHSPSKRPHL